MQLTKGAIGNLINRYRAVLKKCHLLNVFGSLAVAGMLVMGGAAAAGAVDVNPVTGAGVLYYNGSLYFADDTLQEDITLNQDKSITANISNKNSTNHGILTNLRQENGGEVSSITIVNSTFSNNGESGAVSLWSQGTGEDSLTKNISNTIFNQNRTNYSGGAVGIFKNKAFTTLGKTDFTDVTFMQNSAAVNGGGIFVEAENITVNGESNFEKNTATQNGGAIYITKESKLTVNNTIFSNNNAGRNGGAIAGTWGDNSDITVTGSYFTENTSQSGGAIALWNPAINATYEVNDTTFNGNNATRKGGAIVFLSETGVNDKTFQKTEAIFENDSFTNNTAGESGGALHLEYANVDITDSTFTANAAGNQGGAIYNAADSSITFTGDNTFTGNKAEGTNGWGGAIYNAGTLTVDGTSFENNTASAQGGAIYVHPKAELDVTNSYFKGNGGTAGGAIAMFGDNGAAPEHSISNTVFEGNTADRTGDKLGKGGAIAILQMDTPREQYTTKLDLNGVTFIGNTSNGTGGAIHSEYGTLTITDATFSGNSAEQQGGAIYNDANSSITFKGDNLFTVNTADEGKDIYNEGTLDFAGTNTQMDGGMVMAGGMMTVANSQVNMAELDARAGKITVTGSELSVSKLTGNTLGSSLTVGTDGIVNIGNLDTTKLGEAMNDAGMGSGSAVLALNTTMTLDNNARLVVGTDASENKATAVFGENSLLVVDAEGVADKQAIHADGHDSKTAFIHSGAQLRIINAVAGEYVTVLNGFDTIQNEDGVLEASWTNKDGVDNLDYMLSSYAMIMEGSDGQPDVVVVSELNDPTAALPGIDPDLAPVLNEVWANKLNDEDSPDMGVRFLSRAARADYINGDAAKSAATIESAARIAFAGAVPQMTKMASDAATNAVVNRLGFANPADGAQAMNAEGKIVDRNTTGFALWIAPLWQNQHGWGMEAGNLDYGFNGNLGGVSLGADYTFENAIRAGITFNIGGGYAESSGGDLNSTENRMTFWGLGAYAGWNYENFGLMADVSYTSTWNDLEQDLDPGMGMGDLEADVQATAISAGLRAEYKLETSVLDIIPHIGVRYMSLNTWGYDVDANGGTVLEGDGFHQDIWTFPIGVTFSKDFTLDSGWFFKPSVDFSVIPAAGDIKAKHDVQFTGAPAVAEMETQMMDYLTWQGGVGIQMGNDNLSFGVNYTLQAGQNTTGHGVFGSFRYEF